MLGFRKTYPTLEAKKVAGRLMKIVLKTCSSEIFFRRRIKSSREKTYVQKRNKIKLKIPIII